MKKGVPGVLPRGVDNDNLCALSAAGGAEAGATRLVLHVSGIRLIGVAAAGGEGHRGREEKGEQHDMLGRGRGWSSRCLSIWGKVLRVAIGRRDNWHAVSAVR